MPKGEKLPLMDSNLSWIVERHINERQKDQDNRRMGYGFLGLVGFGSLLLAGLFLAPPATAVALTLLISGAIGSAVSTASISAGVFGEIERGNEPQVKPGHA